MDARPRHSSEWAPRLATVEEWKAHTASRERVDCYSTGLRSEVVERMVRRLLRESPDAFGSERPEPRPVADQRRRPPVG